MCLSPLISVLLGRSIFQLGVERGLEVMWRDTDSGAECYPQPQNTGQDGFHFSQLQILSYCPQVLFSPLNRKVWLALGIV
jgi:hypothetical protein